MYYDMLYTIEMRLRGIQHSHEIVSLEYSRIVVVNNIRNYIEQ